MQYTSNYNLPQWEDTDVVTRGDVNGAMAAVDSTIAGVAAAAGNLRVETWTYSGHGNHGENYPTVLTFSARPVLFLVKSRYVVLFGHGDVVSCARLTSNTYGEPMDITWDGNTASFYSAVSDMNQAQRGTDNFVMAFYLTDAEE